MSLSFVAVCGKTLLKWQFIQLGNNKVERMSDFELMTIIHYSILTSELSYPVYWYQFCNILIYKGWQWCGLGDKYIVSIDVYMSIFREMI